MKNKTFMRILASGMAAVMAAAALSAAACSDKPSEASPTGEPKQTQSGQTGKATPKPAETDSGYEKSDLLTKKYKVPRKNILMDAPSHKYHETEQGGCTQLYSVYGKRYVAVTYDPEETTASAKEALDLVWENYKRGLENDCRIKELNITSESTETVNGVEVYKFVGTATRYLDYYGDKSLTREVFTIGFSFVKDNTPVSVIGSVINEEQKQEDIDEITAIVEAMMKTVRDSGR
ncbi:MAG: hypothetical protein IKZ82_11435 [Clostridia bacterium]|nr:hypothetical protein [Clostridia bacterium]